MTDPADTERFTALYDQYARRVYAYAVTQAGRGHADDVVSEVFLVAWRRLADVPRPELPWLLGVARKVVAGQYRAAARQQAIAAEMRAWLAEAAARAGDPADDISERSFVLHALATLPAPDRELLTLVAWHGLAPREAAQVVGCSTAAYFVRLHRARRAWPGAAAAAVLAGRPRPRSCWPGRRPGGLAGRQPGRAGRGPGAGR